MSNVSGGGGYGGGGKGGSYGGPVMYYGVIIHDTIKRGNADEMKQVLADAKKQRQELANLDKAIQELEAAIGGK